MDNAIVDALVASLNDPNAGWEYSEYTASNTRVECEIWIANGAGWLDVEFSGPKIGGSVHYRAGHSLFFPKGWARRIYKAARPHQLQALAAQQSVTTDRIIPAIQSASSEASDSQRKAA